MVAVTDIDWTTSDRIATFAERLEILSLPRATEKRRFKIWVNKQKGLYQRFAKKRKQDLQHTN